MLTVEILIDNAQKALDEKRLQFFDPDLPGSATLYTSTDALCKYRDGEYCCAVGASIPNNKYKEIIEGKSVEVALAKTGISKSKNLIQTDDFLQYNHDQITKEVAHGICSVDTAIHNFEQTLDEARQRRW